MSETSIRPEAVALLTDVAIDPHQHYTQWTRRDGTPLTDEEQRLIGSATAPELQAVADYSQRIIEREEQMSRAFTRLAELAIPYFAQLPEGAVMDDVVPLMSEDDRAEFERLAELVAPDGTVVPPSAS